MFALKFSVALKIFFGIFMRYELILFEKNCCPKFLFKVSPEVRVPTKILFMFLCIVNWSLFEKI